MADSSHHPSAVELRAAHLKWLLSTGQEDRAGGVKEREGDVTAAIGLYLKGGVPARAAQVRRGFVHFWVAMTLAALKFSQHSHH